MIRMTEAEASDMAVPLQTTCKGMHPSWALEARIREEAPQVSGVHPLGRRH